MDMTEMTDQQVVNRIVELRPASATMPLGVEVRTTHVEWNALSNAELEIKQRGYIESGGGIWGKPGAPDGELLIYRP